jgi:hypothetical protein
MEEHQVTDVQLQSEIRSVLVLVTAQARLAEIHEEICRSLDMIHAESEILYLVRQGDRDELAQAREISEQNPGRVRVLQFSQSSSDAEMLSVGANSARGEVLLTVPARFETDLACLPALDAAITDGADVAIAARNDGDEKSSARAQSQLFSRLVSGVTGSRFADVASGTRAIRKRVLQEIPLYGEFHRYLPVLAERSGFSVVELQATTHSRASAPIVHAPNVYLWRAIDVVAIMFISRFTRMPLRLFGSVGLGFAATGSVVLFVIGIQRLLGTPLSDRPILVLAILLIGLGVQVFTIGLLGELIVFFRARKIRDYRVETVYEAEPSVLPLPREDAPNQNEELAHS